VALKVTAPLAGTAVPLSDVPDPVFAEGIVGPGVAVRPDPGARTAAAPIAGVLAKVKPHAFVVVSPDGRGVLVHLGIDTVSLGGDGFAVLAAEGAAVEVGDAIIEWDPVAVEAGGRSAICPVIALDAPSIADAAAGPVLPGAPIFSWPDPDGST
jgi:glucose-specific phosphotransferase system IIA component